MAEETEDPGVRVARAVRAQQKERWDKAEKAYERWVGVEHSWKNTWCSGYASALVDDATQRGSGG